MAVKKVIVAAPFVQNTVEYNYSLAILGYYDTLVDLTAAVTAPTVGDVYGVGTVAPYTIYIWDGTVWVDNGTLKGEKGDTGEPGADGADGDGAGDVVGPASATGDNFAAFDGVTGKLLKDSGKKASDFLSTATPKLGGDMDLDTYKLTKTGAGAYEFGTDEKQVDFNSNTASFTLVNNTTATTIDWRKSNKQTVAPTSAPTYTFTAPQGACNLVLKLTQPASALTIAFPASVKWCGATPDFNVNNGVFFICFFFDGTDYNGTAVKRV